MFWSYIISGLSIFVFYGFSLSLLLFIKKILAFRSVSESNNIINVRGFVKSFSFFALAVLFLSAWNSYFLGAVGITSAATMSSPYNNNFGIAIGTAALLLYYQYVSKMF